MKNNKCPYCGAPINAAATECKHCGASITSAGKKSAYQMERKNTGVFVKIAIFALAVFAVVSIVQLQLSFNELRTKRDTLKAEVDALQDEADELQEQVEAPVDEEYIIDIAKDKLNLRLPEEIIFYNDLYN